MTDHFQARNRTESSTRGSAVWHCVWHKGSAVWHKKCGLVGLLRSWHRGSAVRVLVGAASTGKWLGMGRQVRVVATSPFVSQTLKPMLAGRRLADLEAIVELVESGKLSPVIDAVYPIEQAADAVRHVQQGHARGKVVVAI